MGAAHLLIDLTLVPLIKRCRSGRHQSSTEKGVQEVADVKERANAKAIAHRRGDHN